MPAHSSVFPWTSYYPDYPFFMTAVGAHDKVRSIRESGHAGIYEVETVSGRVLRVFICECYSFGRAEYQEVVQKLGPVDTIVIDSNWCGYTSDAKRYCRDQRVGLFKIGEFMGALNLEEAWTYLTPDQKKQFREKGWI